MEWRSEKRNTTSACLIMTLAMLLLASLAPPPGVCAPYYPARQGLVNDFAGVLSPRTVRALETLSRELLEKSGATVAVAVMPSLSGVPVEEYATRLYEKWGIGRKGEDRGALLLVAVEERRVRIETGYGLEGILPDGKVGAILDEDVIPHLRRDDWDSGVIGGTVALIGVVAADAGVTLEGRIEAPRPIRRSKRSGGASIIPLIIFLILMSRSRLFPWILLPMMMGRRGPMGRGGFGSFGGGFGSFGGGGGGGFSGFGGGMSGGGGASRGF